jgi:hypothetical protein
VAENETMNRWEVKEAIQQAIDLHETRKASMYVPFYALDLYKKEIEARVKDLETDAAEEKDRNRWLFRLVVGAVITSFIPILIALLSRGSGGLLR